MTHPAAPAHHHPPEGSPPDTDGVWLRAADAAPAEPRWGFADGLQVGLHPLRGPRGLLRIYAPYLGHPRDRLLNFIAIEPIPQGATERGYSELETAPWTTRRASGSGARTPPATRPRATRCTRRAEWSRRSAASST
jgi:hypothetical protein